MQFPSVLLSFSKSFSSLFQFKTFTSTYRLFTSVSPLTQPPASSSSFQQKCSDEATVDYLINTTLTPQLTNTSDGDQLLNIVDPLAANTSFRKQWKPNRTKKKGVNIGLVFTVSQCINVSGTRTRFSSANMLVFVKHNHTRGVQYVISGLSDGKKNFITSLPHAQISNNLIFLLLFLVFSETPAAIVF